MSSKYGARKSIPKAMAAKIVLSGFAKFPTKLGLSEIDNGKE